MKSAKNARRWVETTFCNDLQTSTFYNMLPPSMRYPHPTPRGGTERNRRSRGFTLVEIAVAAVIIGLIAAIAIPGFKRSVMAARSDAVINDMRVFSTAFQHYMQDKGDWPEDSGPGSYPSGMEQYLRTTTWTRKSPIGGFYNWEAQSTHGGNKIRAAIAISGVGEDSVSSDRMQLEDIDRRCDDGDLSSGNFRLGFGLEPLYIVEP